MSQFLRQKRRAAEELVCLTAESAAARVMYQPKRSGGMGADDERDVQPSTWC
ncbi:MAG: hypothetical protein IT422_28510 [Pirellulaceae bacterium]|nr:hypothetical protein [Pirellulaceae bacterium]